MSVIEVLDPTPVTHVILVPLGSALVITVKVEVTSATWVVFEELEISVRFPVKIPLLSSFPILSLSFAL